MVLSEKVHCVFIFAVQFQCPVHTTWTQFCAQVTTHVVLMSGTQSKPKYHSALSQLAVAYSAGIWKSQQNIWTTTKSALHNNDALWLQECVKQNAYMTHDIDMLSFSSHTWSETLLIITKRSAAHDSFVIFTCKSNYGKVMSQRWNINTRDIT